MATKNLKKVAEEEREELEQGFDDAVKERKVPYTVVEILGKEFEIPTIPPASVTFFIAKFGKGDNKEVPHDKYLDFVMNIVGDKIADHVMEKGSDCFDIEGEIILPITNVWNPKTKKK